MGWSSFSEDIEEIRAHWDHLRDGVEGILTGLEGTSPAEVAREEDRLKRLAENLTSIFGAISSDANKTIEEAKRLWIDPRSQVLKRLEKREKQLDALRSEISSLKDQLAKSRSDRERFENECKTLRAENIVVQKEIAEIRGDESWKDGVKPLRK